MTKRVKLPEPVAEIYRAVAELEARYHPRKFTPDGHLVGSIGEVVAAEALGLTLYPMSRAGHDACDADGCQVQIKMTAGKSVAMYMPIVHAWWSFELSRPEEPKSSTTALEHRHGPVPVPAHRAVVDDFGFFGRDNSKDHQACAVGVHRDGLAAGHLDLTWQPLGSHAS